MAKNLEEAVAEVAREHGLPPSEIIDNEIIMEVEAEVGEEYVVWIHEDGHTAIQGEPIGFDTIYGVSEIFTPYEQFTDKDFM